MNNSYIPRTTIKPTKAVSKMPLPELIGLEAAFEVGADVGVLVLPMEDVPLPAVAVVPSNLLVVLAEEPDVPEGEAVDVYVVAVNEHD